LESTQKGSLPRLFFKKKKVEHKNDKKKGEREPVSKRNHKQKATMSKPKSTTPVKID
jgi:hypothetical protein